MQIATLPGTDLCVSRFTFGTGSLLAAGRKRARLRLLFAAAEAGFTHFDTSPYYGFGLAERDLATLLKARPELTFTTKVGLFAPGGSHQPEWAVLLRKALGRGVPGLSRPIVDFTVKSARQSLEESLRRTGRDRIDLYAIHDPLLRLVDTEEWNNWLRECSAGGKIRYAGMATDSERLLPFIAARQMVGTVVQMRDSVGQREADILYQYGMEPQFTYGYVSAARRHDPTASAEDILRGALRRNPKGSVVVTSSKMDRLEQYARLLAEGAS